MEKTAEVIEWLRAKPNKKQHKFIVFDIKDFYSSLSKKLLTNLLNQKHQSQTKTWKSSTTPVSLFYHNNSAWMKKNGNLFDATIGEFDGAEVCELVGIFIQNKLSETYDISDFGFYRDDWPAIFKT